MASLTDKYILRGRQCTYVFLIDILRKYNKCHLIYSEVQGYVAVSKHQEMEMNRSTS